MGWRERADRYWLVTERGSTLGREVKAGVVTFLTASYILLVNPQILGLAGLPVKPVVTATALSSSLACLLTGLFANLPVGVSPGMGLNAYLVFSQVLGLGVSPERALAGCFTAACLVAALALARALAAILGVVPNSIKLAVVVGMGLLLSFIGLQTSRIVVADPATMVTMGSLLQPEPLLAVGGLALIAALHHRNVRGSILLGVLATALGYWATHSSWPTRFFALPVLRVFSLDFSALFTRAAFDPAAWSAVLAYTLVMVFDVGGALTGLGNLAGLLHEGQVPGTTATYLAAAAATGLGAWTGTTPLIVAAESAVGIKEGGRTGLVAVTVSACFAASLFLAPLLQAVPQLATAPVLVLVGAMMMGECTHIDWGSMLTAVPAFLTIVIQPFTFSIANGIYAGLAMSALLYLLTGSFMDHLPWGAAKQGDDADLERPLVADDDDDDDNHPPTPRPPGSPAAGGHHIPVAAVHVRRGRPAGSCTSSEHSGASTKHGSSYERASFTLYLNTSGSLGRHSLGGRAAHAADDASAG